MVFSYTKLFKLSCKKHVNCELSVLTAMIFLLLQVFFGFMHDLEFLKDRTTPLLHESVQSR